ncbi:transglutaminase superfamily protein [Thermovibrio guaymasensis]|uniref:Transglutaminase superfamily protein n=1 Tax=Thermovibrio guaymasensis TaxID=240167 RepID=A0A420W9W8_9BACT|nr:transglutaminase-like domain-containing protein [Thermovibrio guaymasensis]RKQ64058.1 transglutaminase superfamily protein [Thermovibrio guaymasensis]
MFKTLIKALLLLTVVSTASFSATYQVREVVDVKPQPKAKLVEVWIPLPYENDWQKVKNIKVSSPFTFTVQREKEYGNRFIYVRHEGALREPIKITVEYRVEREELSPKKEECKLPLRYLLSDRLVPVEKFKKLAQEITSGKETDVEKLRAIYDYVVSHMKYDKSGKGWGRGDAIWACDARKGNCTDFHSFFIALSRAVGIPAVFEIGLPISKDGLVKGYHCWVVAYPNGKVFGIDASEASKHPEKRDYFFGHLCDKRFGITRGRDILLSPAQHGARLNYIYKAYEEVDLYPADGVKTYYFVKKLK